MVINTPDTNCNIFGLPFYNLWCYLLIYKPNDLSSGCFPLIYSVGETFKYKFVINKIDYVHITIYSSTNNL